MYAGSPNEAFGSIQLSEESGDVRFAMEGTPLRGHWELSQAIAVQFSATLEISSGLL